MYVYIYIYKLEKQDAKIKCEENDGQKSKGIYVFV